MKIFDRLRGGTRQSWPEQASYVTEILPSSVRYALEHKGAEIGSKEIRELMVPDRRMQRLGFYAGLKAADGNEVLQQALLERIVALQFDPSRLTVPDIAEVLDDLDKRQASVNVKKLAEISRKGFGYWPEHFHEQLAAKVTPEAPLFAMAHSTLIGIDGLARVRGEHRPLHILTPGTFGDPTKAHAGYAIHPDGQVTLLPKDFERPSGAIIVDDIENTGKSRREVEAFWGEGDMRYVPLFGSNSDHSPEKQDVA